MSKSVEIEKDGESYFLSHSYNYDAIRNGKRYMTRFFSITPVDEDFKSESAAVRKRALTQAAGWLGFGVIIAAMTIGLYMAGSGSWLMSGFLGGALWVMALAFLAIECDLFENLFSKKYRNDSVRSSKERVFRTQSFYSDVNSAKIAYHETAMMKAIEERDPRIVDVMMLNSSLCSLLQSSREIEGSMASLSQVVDADNVSKDLQDKVSSFSFEEEIEAKEDLRDALMSELIKNQSKEIVETALLRSAA